ncbi:uncharacterized protein LOC141562095 [Sminthopsis crassicaudata]|uniref:uncharacterized protein LOC141562095 n=1 Tax=Sminthopsis crassicaudata TaxID=9301 RepID=UPI003D692ADF
MERRPKIFPKELVHFPRKGHQNKTPSVLLPCPPHRVSPLWEHRCYKNRTEIITHPDQKGSSPSTSAHKADVSLGEGDKTRPGPASRAHLDSHTGSKSGPVTTAQPTKPSLRHRRSQVRTATMLLGINKKGDRPTASTSSHCLKDWSKAKSLKPPDLAKVLKKSHSDLCPRNMVSLSGYTKSESRTLTLSSHPEQKNKGTSAPSPGHKTTFLREVESWEEAVMPLTDDQITSVADKDHDSVPLLNQVNPEFWDTPNVVSEAKDLPDPNIPFMLQAEQDLREKMTEEMEYQAIIPASRHHETTHLLSASQDGSSDRWAKLTPSPSHQEEATPRLFANVSVQTDQTSLLHVSVQTEEGSWPTMLLGINHQVTTCIGSAHGATSPLDLNPKMTVSGLNDYPIAPQNSVHQVTGNIVDINPLLRLQAERDALGEMEQETDLDQVTKKELDLTLTTGTYTHPVFPVKAYRIRLYHSLTIKPSLKPTLNSQLKTPQTLLLMSVLKWCKSPWKSHQRQKANSLQLHQSKILTQHLQWASRKIKYSLLSIISSVYPVLTISQRVS